MKYELKEHQLKNLMTYLDRVQVKGLNEIQAMQELIYIFQSPIPEENQEKEDDK